MGESWLKAGRWLSVDWPAAKDFSHFSHFYQLVASQRLGAKELGDLWNCKTCEHILFIHGRKRVHGTVTGVEKCSYKSCCITENPA